MGRSFGCAEISEGYEQWPAPAHEAKCWTMARVGLPRVSIQTMDANPGQWRNPDLRETYPTRDSLRVRTKCRTQLVPKKRFLGEHVRVVQPNEKRDRTP